MVNSVRAQLSLTFNLKIKLFSNEQCLLHFHMFTDLKNEFLMNNVYCISYVHRFKEEFQTEI